jgi:hypothetical protein
MFHQGVFQEDLLSTLDVGAGEQGAAGGIRHPGRDRRRSGVGLDGDQGQQAESEDHHQDDGWSPPVGYG